MSLTFFLEEYKNGQDIEKEAPSTSTQYNCNFSTFDKWIKKHSKDLSGRSHYVINKKMVQELLSDCHFLQLNPVTENKITRYIREGDYLDEEFYNIVDRVVSTCSVILRNFDFNNDVLVYHIP